MATKFITVSIEIMHDKNLNQSQKFILAEIEQLSQLDDGCFASNQHFSDLIGITKENVSRNINELEKLGYIDIEIKKGSRNHTRIITLTTLVRPPYQNSKTPLSKQQETKENIQSNKTINTENEIYEAYKAQIKASKRKQSAINNISTWLKEYSKDDLLKALHNYKSIAEKQPDKKFVKECANFFGVKDTSRGYFIDFIDYKEEPEKVQHYDIYGNPIHGNFQ